MHQCAYVNFRQFKVNYARLNRSRIRDEAFRPTLRHPAENVSRAVYDSECE